jgi:Protein of unknown function (DUF1656)
MKLGRLLSCSIAAFFPQAGRAALEPVGRSDRWIDYPVHPTGWGRPEISVAGLLLPWIVTIAALGFLAAWLVTAILERTGLARHVWHLPLCFLALVILFSTCFRPCSISVGIETKPGFSTPWSRRRHRSWPPSARSLNF